MDPNCSLKQTIDREREGNFNLNSGVALFNRHVLHFSTGDYMKVKVITVLFIVWLLNSNCLDSA